ncbi:MAG: helix-turn-helix domain-containing protein [Novosphingobium sp.]|jgi:excisionase family DNA binding protein|nr:helix-turn-helix domain-containing protein [Novosphingobium sp.]
MHKAHRSTVNPLSYGITDAAAALGVSPRSIYNLVDAGKLRKVKVGSRSLIPADSLKQLIEGEAA